MKKKNVHLWPLRQIPVTIPNLEGVELKPRLLKNNKEWCIMSSRACLHEFHKSEAPHTGLQAFEFLQQSLIADCGVYYQNKNTLTV